MKVLLMSLKLLWIWVLVNEASPQIARTFDLSNYNDTDHVSFTIPVQFYGIVNGDYVSEIEFNWINGNCHKPTLQVDFQNTFVDLDYINVYNLKYPDNLIKQCKSAYNWLSCRWSNCVQNYLLSNASMNSITIYVLKSWSINSGFCEGYDLNANVTITCSKLPNIATTTSTALVTDSKTLDSSTTNNKSVQSEIINMDSTQTSIISVSALELEDVFNTKLGVSHKTTNSKSVQSEIVFIVILVMVVGASMLFFGFCGIYIYSAKKNKQSNNIQHLQIEMDVNQLTHSSQIYIPI